MPPGVVAFRRERFTDVLRSGRASRFEEFQDDRWFDTVVEPVLSGAGEVSRIAVISRDITDRTRVEEALRESRAKYQALIETNPDFIWEMDAEGRYTYCSPQMERLWGIPPGGMIGRTPFDMMPSEERERAIAAFAEMVRAPRAVSWARGSASYDGRGNVIALEISGVPFFCDDGVLLGYRGITRDVTETGAGRGGPPRERGAAAAGPGGRTGSRFWDRDAVTDRVIVAPGFIQRYRLDPEAMATYADWERYIHPDDREKVETGRKAALGAGEPIDLEFRIVIPRERSGGSSSGGGAWRTGGAPSPGWSG